MIATKQQRRRDTKKLDAANLPTRPLTAVTSVHAAGASEVTVNFSSFVMIDSASPPATWLFGTANRTIVSVVSGTGTSYTFLLTGTAPSTEAYTIPANDPNARNTFGGYVGASSGTIAA